MTRFPSPLRLQRPLFTKNRFVVKYDNGKRHVIQYMVPALDRAIFDNAPEVDAVVKSLRTR